MALIWQSVRFSAQSFIINHIVTLSASSQIHRMHRKSHLHASHPHNGRVHTIRAWILLLLRKRVRNILDSSIKITLKSGWAGIGTHSSIIDYLYYSYLFNPVFVRVIIYKKEDKEEYFYSPLSFMESIKCALTLRGFDPIVVKSEREYKNVKYRKMALKTLISECFEELNGPVFIMLPVSVSLL